ncbi:uncharacterized protein KGF55_005570 [Candida pseudojiufengensis]|uniref:uncharacterized protein n=1 Tax=Candida pseudojiufengensis TaxID=497109 RepID=UPI00222502D7|nr:uncharacterized protein KGF55_005570 [Candida pseudojiufengensis]KAI5959079.1 hypothetical protein KGF55_005570 [Candida pseudojiufengensis]
MDQSKKGDPNDWIEIPKSKYSKNSNNSSTSENDKNSNQAGMEGFKSNPYVLLTIPDDNENSDKEDKEETTSNSTLGPKFNDEIEVNVSDITSLGINKDIKKKLPTSGLVMNVNSNGKSKLNEKALERSIISIDQDILSPNDITSKSSTNLIAAKIDKPIGYENSSTSSSSSTNFGNHQKRKFNEETPAINNIKKQKRPPKNRMLLRDPIGSFFGVNNNNNFDLKPDEHPPTEHPPAEHPPAEDPPAESYIQPTNASDVIPLIINSDTTKTEVFAQASALKELSRQQEILYKSEISNELNDIHHVTKNLVNKKNTFDLTKMVKGYDYCFLSELNHDSNLLFKRLKSYNHVVGSLASRSGILIKESKKLKVIESLKINKQLPEIYRIRTADCLIEVEGKQILLISIYGVSGHPYETKDIIKSIYEKSIITYDQSTTIHFSGDFNFSMHIPKENDYDKECREEFRKLINYYNAVDSLGHHDKCYATFISSRSIRAIDYDYKSKQLNNWSTKIRLFHDNFSDHLSLEGSYNTSLSTQPSLKLLKESDFKFIQNEYSKLKPAFSYVFAVDKLQEIVSEAATEFEEDGVDGDIMRLIDNGELPTMAIEDYLQPRNIGPWSNSENELLIKLIKVFGGNLSAVAMFFPARKYWQIKDHYFNVADKTIKKGSLTPSEKEEIVNLRNQKKSYLEIGIMIKRGPELVERYLMREKEKAEGYKTNDYSIEETDQLLKLVNDGMKLGQISKILKRSRRNLYLKLRRLNYYTELNIDEKSQIEEMLRSNISHGMIAAKLHRNRLFIMQYINSIEREKFVQSINERFFEVDREAFSREYQKEELEIIFNKSDDEGFPAIAQKLLIAGYYRTIDCIRKKHALLMEQKKQHEQKLERGEIDDEFVLKFKSRTEGWSGAEEQKLNDLVAKYGRRFPFFAENYFPNRSAQSLQHHYNYVNPSKYLVEYQGKFQIINEKTYQKGLSDSKQFTFQARIPKEKSPEVKNVYDNDDLYEEQEDFFEDDEIEDSGDDEVDGENSELPFVVKTTKAYTKEENLRLLAIGDVFKRWFIIRSWGLFPGRSALNLSVQYCKLKKYDEKSLNSYLNEPGHNQNEYNWTTERQNFLIDKRDEGLKWDDIVKLNEFSGSNSRYLQSYYYQLNVVQYLVEENEYGNFSIKSKRYVEISTNQNMIQPIELPKKYETRVIEPEDYNPLIDSFTVEDNDRLKKLYKVMKDFSIIQQVFNYPIKELKSHWSRINEKLDQVVEYDNSTFEFCSKSSLHDIDKSEKDAKANKIPILNSISKTFDLSGNNVEATADQKSDFTWDPDNERRLVNLAKAMDVALPKRNWFAIAHKTTFFPGKSNMDLFNQLNYIKKRK